MAGKQFVRWTEDLAGGPARFQIIFVLSSVLELDAADKATISAVAAGLEKAFHIGNTEIGLLVAAALAIPARRAYPRDVATAAEAVRRMRGKEKEKAGGEV
ncbi:MAG: hypothetical protein ACREF3_15120 [Acetobacteraceae bacterium]